MKTDFSPENKRILLYHPSIGNRRSGSSLFWEKIEKFSDGNKITYLDRSFSRVQLLGIGHTHWMSSHSNIPAMVWEILEPQH